MNKPKIVDIKNLNFIYNKNDLVLQNINLDIYHKDFLAIIGPNGGGKTTLIKLILGILPTINIKVFGTTPKKSSHKIGYVMQDTIPNKNIPINVIDVVLMGLMNKNKFFYSKKDKFLALNLLDKVGMSAMWNKKISLLSGGENQRVLIARALISNPSLLILDEPTSNIDPQGQNEIYKLLKEINQTNTIIVISHDISLVYKYASKVAFINKNISMHNHINNIKMEDDKHFCEIELLNHLKDCSWKF